MRVLSVIDSFAHGGAETVLVDLVLGLPEHQHHVVHFSAANGIAAHQPFVRRLAAHGVGVSDVHWSCFSPHRGWAEVLDGVRPDVILFHWWGQHPWQAWVDRAAAVRSSQRPSFVLVLHHAGIPAPFKYDRYVLVTEAQVAQVAGFRPRRIRVIPNGVDLRRFRRPRPSRLSSDMVVGRISSMRGGKIAPDLVDTLVDFDVPRTRYVLAGDGELRSVLARRRGERAAEERVTLPGYVPRDAVPGALAGFDVFCYSTSTAAECHPLVFLEALASGVPIVAESKGGIRGVVQHGVNGFLGESMEEVGEYLQQLRRDDTLRDRLARGARASAARFASSHQIEAYRALLREVDEERVAMPRRPWCE